MKNRMIFKGSIIIFIIFVNILQGCVSSIKQGYIEAEVIEEEFEDEVIRITIPKLVNKNKQIAQIIEDNVIEKRTRIEKQYEDFIGEMP